ncbi:hypothetical protein EYC84_011211 [Monilinia fructicola]|uniref:FAD-dependent oxidoreductase 2 FAD-binding domain-containing protein n=1 Tax=Monilinia fructicola TaxID=38448 RepID=A0A5M9J6A6_MONFR|nr:hypothetical protein EYC84_011211 [Monilinia fructicola]
MPSSPPQDKPKIAVVIGSGLAGLAASSQLLSQNRDIEVYLLEQASRTGGNSIKASSGINGAGTSYQLTSSPPIADSVERFYEDSVKSAGDVMGASGNEKETKRQRDIDQGTDRNVEGEGGVLLVGGKRFVDELDTRKVVTEKIMEFEGVKSEEGKPKQWDVKLVIDEGVYEKTKSHVDFYLWKGLMRKSTIAEANLGEAAVESLQAYADIVAKRKSDELGRKAFGYWKLDQVRADS